MKAEFYRRVSETIDANNMLSGVKALLCAFSGGADSTALLVVMRKICAERGIGLYAAHVNHMIRGNEARRDMLHCQELCEKFSVDFTAICVDVPMIAARDRLGLEEAARRERYRILNEIAASKGCEKICTAHNSGDNLETVLFNLARGTGLNGICGIAPVRDNIIRPLISTPREDIIALLQDEGVDFVTDSTNFDTAYTRNFIRAELVPMLKRVNPAAERNVSRMCGSLREDNYALNALSRGEDVSASDPIIARKIAAVYRALTSEALENIHISSALALIRGGKLWARLDLPLGITLVITREGWTLERAVEKAAADEQYYTLCSPEKRGEVNIIGLTGGVKAFLSKYINENINIYNLSIHKTLNSAKIIGTVSVRFRREGDVIFTRGQHKSVKKLLSEAHIPPDERSALPFFCDDEGIFWIPGVAVRDGAEASEGDLLAGISVDTAQNGK